jgi:putative ABC transport system substrate-binding protein
MTVTIGRRELLAALGGAAAWPLAARAQPSDRMRRIGALMGGAGSDPVEQARLAAFLDGLQQLGWTDGRNVRIDIRWPAADADRYRSYAADLVGLAPDVILASASVVASLAHPGGNATGFTAFEYGISGKWLELLKEIAPH